MEPIREKVAENKKLNFRVEQIFAGSRGIGMAFFLFGVGISSYFAIRTLHTVRRLVLRKGGKYVQIQTYGMMGGAGRVQTIPVVHCSGVQQPFTKTDRFFLKVKDHTFSYQLNLEEGIVSNKPLFNRTVGLGRTI